jgi:saccharolysin
MRRLAQFATRLHQQARLMNTMSGRIAPQKAPSWTITADEISKQVDKIIAENRAVDDEIAKETNPTFENVFLKAAKIEDEQQGVISPLTFYQRVSSDASLREASTKAEELLENYFIEAGTREDVYQNIRKAFESLPRDKLDAESVRFAEKVEKRYRRNGLGLEDKQERDRVTALRKELSSVCIQFAKNLDSENGYLDFTKEELAGVPERVLGQFEQQPDGKLRMTFKMPDVQPVLKYARNSATRKRVFVGYENRCAEAGNVELVEKAVRLRAEISKALGYKYHADYVLEERMAKNGETVKAFLEDLRGKLDQKGKEEVEGLFNLKQAYIKEQGLPTEGEDKLWAWDTRFYDNLLLEREYQVDDQKIAEYFPVEQTVSGMLQLFERLFSLEFSEITDESKSVWHPDVRQYSVWSTEKSDEPSFVGWFYLDLHPRPNKYGHAANFSLSKGYHKQDGTRVYPVTALVCNFSKPTATTPSLLKHDEVTTLFHELGHGIHDLVGDAKFSRFSGNSVDWDFVEAPSQMLEFWTWDHAQLKALSGHYENPSEKLDDKLIDSLVKAKHVNGALFVLRQLHFGLFDLTLHTSTPEGASSIDVCQLWNDLRQNISHVSQGDQQRVHGYSSFGHIMGGYDAGYYGYLWSEVFATDMFYTRFKANPVDPTVGMEYRKKVIGRGGSVDQTNLLRDFLGREPNNQAFLQELGISN